LALKKYWLPATLRLAEHIPPAIDWRHLPIFIRAIKDLLQCTQQERLAAVVEFAESLDLPEVSAKLRMVAFPESQPYSFEVPSRKLDCAATRAEMWQMWSDCASTARKQILVCTVSAGQESPIGDEAASKKHYYSRIKELCAPRERRR